MAVLLGATLTLAPATAEEGGAPAPEGPSAKGREGPSPTEAPKKPLRVILKPGGGGASERAAPPTQVRLPPAGTYPAKEILPLAGSLSGRTVILEGARLGESRVDVPKALGASEVGLRELSLVLRASQIYLFDHEDPDEGKVLVATRDPQWKPEPEGHLRVLEPSPGDFDTVAQEVKKVVAKRNRDLPRGEEPMVAVDSPRAGKIIVSSPRTEDIAAIDEAVSAFFKKDEDRGRPRLFTYVGRYRKVEALMEELQSELEEGERNQLRIIVASGGKGNRLLYRCPVSLGEKVKEILEKLDVPKKPANKPEETPAK